MMRYRLVICPWAQSHRKFMIITVWLPWFLEQICLSWLIMVCRCIHGNVNIVARINTACTYLLVFEETRAPRCTTRLSKSFPTSSQTIKALLKSAFNMHFNSSISSTLFRRWIIPWLFDHWFWCKIRYWFSLTSWYIWTSFRWWHRCLTYQSLLSSIERCWIRQICIQCSCSVLHLRWMPAWR
jgi:hypothetical protein